MALEDYRAEMDRCSVCSYCKWVPFDQIKSWRFARGCPSIAFSNFQSYSARGRYAVARSLLEGKSSYSPTVTDVVFKCQACGSCDVSCKICRYNLEPLDMIRELRAKLVSDGQTLPEHRKLIKGLSQSDNMLLKPKSTRGKWAEGLDVKNITTAKANVVFHAGCRFSYDPDQQKVARAAVSLLSKAGIDIGIMGEGETCCGGRAFGMGFREEFKRCAESNIKAWQKAGAKTIVTSCSDCYHAFKRLYPAYLGSQFEVVHTVEYLERLIQTGQIKLTKNVPMKITYHDPCHLGRQGEPYVAWNGKEKKIFNQVVIYDPVRPRYNGTQGVYASPRNVLQSIPGLKLIEMERIKEYAWCCGAGAGVYEAYPDFSRWTASERIEEANSTGADAIVSACPWCERNFLDATLAKGDKLKVYDVMDLVQLAI
jgi:Fe-S oxidoreductase